MWNLQQCAKTALAVCAGLVLMAQPVLSDAQGALSADTTTSDLLWENSNGQASLWQVNSSSLTQTTYFTYGPFSGWKPTGIVSDNSLGLRRMLWTGTVSASNASAISIWTMNGAYQQTGYKAYNGGTGWVARSIGCSVYLTPTYHAGLYTYVLWRNNDGRISLWKLDNDLNLVSSKVYGPYGGWTAVHMSVNAYGNIRLLWTNTSGQASLWKLDANMNMQDYRAFGPYGGWTPVSLAFNDSGQTRLLWTTTSGSASVWDVDANLNFVRYYQDTIGAGWTASNIGLDDNANTYLIWSKTDTFGHPQGNFIFDTLGQEVYIDKLTSSWQRSSRHYGPFDSWFVASPPDSYQVPPIIK